MLLEIAIFRAIIIWLLWPTPFLANIAILHTVHLSFLNNFKGMNTRNNFERVLILSGTFKSSNIDIFYFSKSNAVLKQTWNQIYEVLLSLKNYPSHWCISFQLKGPSIKDMHIIRGKGFQNVHILLTSLLLCTQNEVRK